MWIYYLGYFTPTTSHIAMNISSLPFVESLGRMAIFYLPIKKLDKKISNEIEIYLLDKFGGFTHEKSEIKGRWKSSNKVFEDFHERYEVSFAGKENVLEFVDFLSNLCEKLNEDSIYLTMGEHSWLVRTKNE